MSDEGLFDADEYLADKSPPADPELKEALDLDREAPLLQADDGELARQVALHSLDKAAYVHFYADIVGRAMKTAYPGPLAWVELFAGPGRLYIKELNAFKPGSPVEAFNIPKPFDTYVFSDFDQRCVDALNTRVGGESVHVLHCDANDPALYAHITSLVPTNALVVLYCDPAGLHLRFDTIRRFADHYKHLDLLLNFPVIGVVRALRAGHEDKASKVLNHPTPRDLIASGRPGPALREWFDGQLRGLGFEHIARRSIMLRDKRVPLYDLMLASREARAQDFFQKAIKRGPGGQGTFDLGDV